MNLKEVFRYTVRLVPLSFAFPDSAHRQNPKHHFRNYLIDVSKACESKTRNEARYRYYASRELSKLKTHSKNDLRKL